MSGRVQCSAARWDVTYAPNPSRTGPHGARKGWRKAPELLLIQPPPRIRVRKQTGSCHRALRWLLFVESERFDADE